MDFKEYLNTQSEIDLAPIATEMYPGNSAARVYLSKKLKGERNWTDNDNELARLAINKLGKKLIDITKK
jgi:hypothetical protein